MANEIAQELIPDPKRMIEGLRDTGYEFNTAIADIVDNSIAAHASAVDIKVDADVRGNIHVSIADNGEGMDEGGLRNAMRYGARVRPSAASLGKYGLGLKTASTAFARRLSVTSRNSSSVPPTMITWDLDHVGQVGKWEVLITDTPDVEAVDHLEEVAANHPGTVVTWSRVDRLIKDYSTPGGKPARKALDRKIDELRDHLAMVYQRFLDPNDTRAPNVSMRLNGTPLSAWDPFLAGTSEVLGQKDIPVQTASGTQATFSVKAYVLPRREEFPDQKSAAAARLSSDMQGIYIYRENRLIHEADWLDMFQKEPHGTLLRVEFSFDHKLDEAFHLDIKKSQIILNEDIWKWLKEEFLPAPRREADRRYREGKQKEIGRKAASGAHDTSNNNIRGREAVAGSGANVSVVNASTGEVIIENAKGKLKLMLPVSSAARPGEVFIKPVPSINDGLLFEPGIVDGHKAVRLNTSHPYYEKVYVPNLNRSVTLQGLDSLMWALAVAELSTIDATTIKHFQDMRFEISKTLRALVEGMPEAEAEPEAEQESNAA
ncbi:ATP-binding protein [Rhodopseudomonas sp.]|uniref:ATP-binding protein n=1 Tax=Rhodopseudomonas sp. TaxID=1078 RepID=UPI003B3AC863